MPRADGIFISPFLSIALSSFSSCHIFHQRHSPSINATECVHMCVCVYTYTQYFPLTASFSLLFFSFFLYLSAQLLLNRHSHMAITQALIRVNAANTNALVFLTHLEETDLLFLGVIIKTTWPLIGCDVRTVAHFVKRCTPLLLV